MIRVWNNQPWPWGLLENVIATTDAPTAGLGVSSRVPPTRAWQDGDTLRVELELPGVEPEAVNVSLTDNTLTVTAKRVYAAEADEGAQEVELSRSLELPFRVEPGQIQAVSKHGILRLTLPRAEADKPRRIEVKAA